MSLTAEDSQAIVAKFGKSDRDSGASEVQIALLTEKLNRLNSHFKTHRHDNHSRVGLLRIVGQRRRLLRYLHRKDTERYKKVIGALGIRK